MEHARLEFDTLAHVDDRYYFAAYCRRCKHRARLSLVLLRERLGPNFRLAKIHEKLRCTACESRLVSMVFLAPDQSLGRLVQPLRRD